MSDLRDVKRHALAPTLQVSGHILHKWEEMGSEKSILGYPVRAALTIKPDAAMQRFEHGYLAYHPSHGTHPVVGKMMLWWMDQLGPYGCYGFPTSDLENHQGESIQRFEHGQMSSAQPEISGGIDLRGEISRRGIFIRDQGKRGTCSVQVMVFLLEYLYAGILGSGYAHLSVEYSNHFSNVATGDRDDGHCFHCMEAAYNAFGIVREEQWPYDKDAIYDFDAAQRRASDDMIAAGKLLLEEGLRAQGHFVKPLDGRVGLNDAQFDEMISLLDAGVPVGVGRDHSLAAVGYRKDTDSPGGGYFLFRNSYGRSADFTGYQTESFAQVKRTVNDLYVYRLLP